MLEKLSLNHLKVLLRMKESYYRKLQRLWEMFIKEEKFNGDLSKKRQRLSVPDSLYHLISLILESDVDVGEVSTNSIALNIVQLVLHKIPLLKR